MSFRILGQGTAVPETVINRADAVGIAQALSGGTLERRTWLPAMYENTGVLTRRLIFDQAVVRDMTSGTRQSKSVFLPTGAEDDCGPTTGQRIAIYMEKAGLLAVQAGRAALRDSHVDPERVTHLITVSCTGFAAPGFDLTMIRDLRLSATVQRTHVGFMGCHGALNGLRVAQAYSTADPDAVVLLCAVELCSLHYHYGWDPQKMIANALFADGAAAILCAANGPNDAWCLSASGSVVIPDSADAMTWTIGDHGFKMTLSKNVPQLIGRHLRPWLSEWLDRCGFAIETIGSWAIHPGGPRILEGVEESLRLPCEVTAASRAVLAEFGNMSSPTVLFILDHLRRTCAPRPCVALAFGPGLVAEAALFT